MAHASSKQKMLEFRRNPVPHDGQAPPPSGNGQAGKPDEKSRSKRQERRKYLRDYARWLWPYRWAIAGVFTLALIIAALDAAWPLAIKAIIDLLDGKSPIKPTISRLNILGGMIAAILVVKQAVDTWRDYRI